LSDLLSFSWEPDSLALNWVGSDPVRFPALWLYDQSSDGRGWSTGQRLGDIADMPENPAIESVSRQADALEIRWTGEKQPSLVAIAWLESVIRPEARPLPRCWKADHGLEWHWADYRSVQANHADRADWLEALLCDGIAFLRGVPMVEAEVLRAAALLGYVIETNYGRLFQVRPEPAPDNLAYTGLALGLHTDNPYREPVPGYQLLHCLVCNAEGGESVFADGFAVAGKLRTEDPSAFRALAGIPVDFRYRDATAELAARRTPITLDWEGQVARIHWNTRSMSTVTLPLDRAEEFYRVWRTFAGMLRGPEFARRVRLQPGELVAFDNGRVLHGRTGFTGERLLEGCYVGRDGVASSLAVLRRRLTISMEQR
jgi:gamma-butyrobetaine dioxygenase